MQWCLLHCGAPIHMALLYRISTKLVTFTELVTFTAIRRRRNVIQCGALQPRWVSCVFKHKYYTGEIATGETDNKQAIYFNTDMQLTKHLPGLTGSQNMQSRPSASIFISNFRTSSSRGLISHWSTALIRTLIGRFPSSVAL